MDNFVLRSYISGVQNYLNGAGYVKYANEEAAEIDNAALAAGLENKVPALLQEHGGEEMPEGLAMDNEAIATEGMPAEMNAPIAKAVAEMAAQAGEEAEVAKAKAAIIENAAVEMASSEKVASVIVVTGQGKGTAAGTTAPVVEAGAPAVGHDPETDVARTSERAAPGTVADLGKGMLGTEEVKPAPAAVASPVVEAGAPDIGHSPETDVARTSPVVPAGTEADQGKGMVGTEDVREKISHILAELNI